MKYFLAVVDSQSDSATTDEMDRITAFNSGLKSRNQLLMAEGLTAPSEATAIDNRTGTPLVSKGSHFPNDEYVSGFWIIEAADDNEATEIALAASNSCNRKVELRPFYR